MESSYSENAVFLPVQCKPEPDDPSEAYGTPGPVPESSGHLQLSNIIVKIEPVEPESIEPQPTEPQPFEVISIKQEIVDEDLPSAPTPNPGPPEVPAFNPGLPEVPALEVKPILLNPAPSPSTKPAGRVAVSNGKQKKQTDDKTNKNTFHCDQCDHTFGSAASLKRHNRVHTTRVAYICDRCQQTFPSKAYLIKHKSNACQYDANLTCQYCGQQFLLENRLQSHLKKHTDERPYVCEICSQAFKWKCTLERHMKLHEDTTSGKPFACKVCGKRFTQAGLIKPHMRTHTGERPFPCPICLKAFSHKHNMMKHQARHSRVKQLVCEICHKQFPKESRLKYHMRVHWLDPKPFKCEHCTKSFSHRQNITRHYKRKHPQYEYSRPETDASVATAVWNNVIECTPPPEYILPQ